MHPNAVKLLVQMLQDISTELLLVDIVMNLNRGIFAESSVALVFKVNVILVTNDERG